MGKNQLQVVILDYPKLMIGNEEVKQVLSDLTQAKQLAFNTTLETYVPLDAQDMIGTHLLIYDTSKIHNPELIMAIRLSYESRSKLHNVKLPVDNYISNLTLNARMLFDEFRKNKPELVDCGAFFKNPRYDYKQSARVPLGDLIFFNVAVFILRKGLHNFVASGNLKFNLPLRVSKIAEFRDDLVFQHPQVPDPHLFCMIERFKPSGLLKQWNKFSEIMSNSIEIIPSEEACNLISLSEAMDRLQFGTEIRKAG